MKTILYDTHLHSGARIVNFSGWEMPLQYRSIVEEHKAVREKVGIFDVSHMGRISLEGDLCENFLSFLSTNEIQGKPNQRATYTVLTNSQGFCIDDVIIYKIDSSHFFVVANASNKAKDLAHLQNYAKNFSVKVTPKYEKEGILAIQGPHSTALLNELFKDDITHLRPFHFVKCLFHHVPLYISYTGYTGEIGYEIYAPNEIIQPLWDSLLTHGKKYGITPAGLGARDTLRLEMGYALYGHELSESIYASESISSWTIKHTHEFLGQDALKKIESNSIKRHAYGVIMNDRAIPREGYDVIFDNKSIGKVTSGTYSISLNRPIGLILVDRRCSPGDQLEILIRNKRYPATIQKLPFYKKIRRI